VHFFLGDAAELTLLDDLGVLAANVLNGNELLHGDLFTTVSIRHIGLIVRSLSREWHTIGCRPFSLSQLVILPAARSTNPSKTAPPLAMTTTSATRGGLGDAGLASHAVMTALRGSCRDTTLKKRSPWALVTMEMACSISWEERGSKG
jgi:hypothetical protein